MIEPWIVILIHQLLFQGMFFIKNLLLERKLGRPVRGGNSEANSAIRFFIVFIAASMVLSAWPEPPGSVQLLRDDPAAAVALFLLLISLLVAAASLLHLGDSWRVGVPQDDATELVCSGIYRFSRNPYFLSYLLMFAGYTVLLQNLLLLIFLAMGFYLIRKMIIREEVHLLGVHGDAYRQYAEKVPRFL